MNRLSEAWHEKGKDAVKSTPDLFAASCNLLLYAKDIGYNS